MMTPAQFDAWLTHMGLSERRIAIFGVFLDQHLGEFVTHFPDC